MRMWGGVNTKFLCDRHLLGEHVEMHMFVGTIKKGISIDGYIKKGLVNPSRIISRHSELSQEMIKRGMNHNSPIVENLYDNFPDMIIDEEINLLELQKRCKACRNKILKG